MQYWRLLYHCFLFIHNFDVYWLITVLWDRKQCCIVITKTCSPDLKIKGKMLHLHHIGQTKIITTLPLIGHFPFAFYLCYKMNPCAKLFIWKWVRFPWEVNMEVKQIQLRDGVLQGNIHNQAIGFERSGHTFSWHCVPLKDTFLFLNCGSSQAIFLRIWFNGTKILLVLTCLMDLNYINHTHQPC